MWSGSIWQCFGFHCQVISQSWKLSLDFNRGNGQISFHCYASLRLACLVAAESKMLHEGVWALRDVCVYREPWRRRLQADSVSAAAPLPSSGLPCTWNRTTTTEGTCPEIQSNVTWLEKRLGYGIMFHAHRLRLDEMRSFLDVKL